MAAGKGKRLKSALPKALHPVCGRPVLWHVLAALRPVRPERVVVVISHGGRQVEEAVRSWDLALPLRFVDQGQPLGTGHAVMAAEKNLPWGRRLRGPLGLALLTWSGWIVVEAGLLRSG